MINGWEESRGISFLLMDFNNSSRVRDDYF